MKNQAMLLALAHLVHGGPAVSARARAGLRTAGWIDAAGTVTDAGRKALNDGVVEAEALSSQGLGDYQEAQDNGRSGARDLAKSQKYLDVANVLRGYH